MAIQAGQNVVVSYKKQSGLGVPASGSGGTVVRFNDGSPGMTPTRATIPNNETRRDGQRTRARLGTLKTSGSYVQNLSVGTQNDWFEAILRSTFTATFQVLPADITSITTTATTIHATSGSFLTKGVRAGMKVKLTNHSTASNNGKWIPVLSVTASDITVPTGYLTLDASPDTSFTIDVAKYLISGAAPVETYWTIDEYDQDLDLSTLFTDCKITKMEISAQPDANIVVTFTLMGLGCTTNASGASPVLTSPTATTTLPLVMADGIIRVGGVAYSVLTGFTLTYDLGGSAPSVLAPNAPDVFLDNAQVSGSFTGMKQDLAFLAAFLAETTIDIYVQCVEPESEPKDFIDFYVGNAVISGASAPVGTTGPRTQTVPWFAGKDESGSGRASTTLLISTSV